MLEPNFACLTGLSYISSGGGRCRPSTVTMRPSTRIWKAASVGSCGRPAYWFTQASMKPMRSAGLAAAVLMISAVCREEYIALAYHCFQASKAGEARSQHWRAWHLKS